MPSSFNTKAFLFLKCMGSKSCWSRTISKVLISNPLDGGIYVNKDIITKSQHSLALVWMGPLNSKRSRWIPTARTTSSLLNRNRATWRLTNLNFDQVTKQGKCKLTVLPFSYLISRVLHFTKFTISLILARYTVHCFLQPQISSLHWDACTPNQVSQVCLRKLFDSAVLYHN